MLSTFCVCAALMTPAVKPAPMPVHPTRATEVIRMYEAIVAAQRHP